MDAKLIPALLPVLVANAVTAWLLAAGRLSMVELLMLISLELVGLQLVAEASVKWGRHARRKRRRFPSGLWGVLLRTLAMAGLAALLWPFQLIQMWLFGAGVEDWRPWLDPLRALAGSELKWPLLITLAGAVWDAASGEDERNRQQLASRLLCLALGGFPFIAPVLLASGATVRALQRAGDTGALPLEPRVIVPGAITVVLVFGGFSLLPWLFSLGPPGWMVSFLSTKVVLDATAAMVTGRRRKGRAA